MNIPYCLPLRERSCNAVLSEVERYRGRYTYFEIWLGTLEDFAETFLDTLSTTLGDKAILLLRKEGLGIDFSPAEQLSIITRISKTRMLLDLDINAQAFQLEEIRKRDLSPRLITSFHDYTTTPNLSSLNSVLTHMETHSPEIFKISTFCTAPEHALRLLEIKLSLNAKKKRSTILGMGPYGAATRVFGSLWGNEIVFAPPSKDKASAPSQLTIDEIESILGILNHAGK